MPETAIRGEEASLLDANVLIALVVVEHEHHEMAEGWFVDQSEVLLCPTVEGALMRYLVRLGESAMTAVEVLHRWREHVKVTFVPDDQSYTEADWSSVRGYRQFTETHLVSLARRHGARLATFDRALVAQHADGARSVPVSRQEG